MDTRAEMHTVHVMAQLVIVRGLDGHTLHPP